MISLPFPACIAGKAYIDGLDHSIPRTKAKDLLIHPFFFVHLSLFGFLSHTIRPLPLPSNRPTAKNAGEAHGIRKDKKWERPFTTVTLPYLYLALIIIVTISHHTVLSCTVPFPLRLLLITHLTTQPPFASSAPLPRLTPPLVRCRKDGHLPLHKGIIVIIITFFSNHSVE